MQQKTLFSGMLLAFLFLQNCQPINPSASNTALRNAKVAAVAEDYFATFSGRKDWEKFCTFYREDLIFEDVLLQLKLDSLWKFKRFYDWPNPAFQKLNDTQESLTVNNMIVNDTVAVAHGVFNPFYWHGQLKDEAWGMNFTIWLYFDQDLKIYKQTDWIEYDPLVLEPVIARVREQGIEKLPAWLNLD